MAALLALHRARDVEPAELFDAVVEHAVAIKVAPGIGEEPERRRHMRAHRRAFRPRRALALAALHLLAHVVVHFCERDVADAWLVHFLLLIPCPDIRADGRDCARPG